MDVVCLEWESVVFLKATQPHTNEFNGVCKHLHIFLRVMIGQPASMTHRPLLEVLRGRRRAPLLFRNGTSSTGRQAVGWRSGGNVGAVPVDGAGGVRS